MIYSLPVPLEDELALGLLGRFARLNGISGKHALEILRTDSPSNERQPPIWMLARACGIDRNLFMSSHSMLPVMYPISSYFGSTREDERQQSISYRGFGTASTSLRWCNECSTKDIETLGFSHWRRRHQISGIDWCVEHRTVLSQLDKAALWDVAQVPTARQGLSSRNCVEPHHPALQRVEEILLAWLQRHRPLRLQAWTKVIGERCRALGLRVGEVGGRQVASDRIREKFPSSWLDKYFPEISSKTLNTYVRKVDGACIDKHVSYPALACVAILAALYESASDAITALTDADSRIAAERKKEPCMQSAIRSFLAGERLQKACDNAGVKLTDVEDLLRSSYRELL